MMPACVLWTSHFLWGRPDARSLIQPTTLGSVQGQDALGQLPAQALDTVARVYIINDRPQTACELGRRLLPRPGWQSPGQATPDP